jgi:hypothetical protein
MYRVTVRVDYEWIGDGAGTALLGQNQGNYPGYGASVTYGAAGVAQSASDFVAEIVPGGDTPSSANFNTALAAAATDLGTRLTTAGATGFTTGTLLAAVQGWATGGP